jgi:hypothetical protein
MVEDNTQETHGNLKLLPRGPNLACVKIGIVLLEAATVSSVTKGRVAQLAEQLTLNQ